MSGGDMASYLRDLGKLYKKGGNPVWGCGEEGCAAIWGDTPTAQAEDGWEVGEGGGEMSPGGGYMV